MASCVFVKAWVVYGYPRSIDNCYIFIIIQCLIPTYYPSITQDQLSYAPKYDPLILQP
ncbi:hypothetical protein BJ508DRAFT_95343 [Ascobolus immersus RN42]|uniref:Uncharacterized protein n=1 Tax=Ascobolus immersus RN42 TaxID=1160509 RepID=A0A3N4IS47_ASCIM|nr:hypothetical protein BJ508DRAFT_95343 [Ascobolus immersus RN42]